MKNLLFIVSSAILLQACVATTTPPKPEPASPATASKEERYSRFSVKGIKKKREHEYQMKLAALQTKIPANDVQNAVNSNQAHLLTYYSGRGGSAKVPGLSPSQLQNSRCQLKHIDGMGDTIYGKNHLQYRAAIVKYAAVFNQLMLRHCQ